MKDDSRLLIRGGRVIDPAQGIDRVSDVVIEGGVIREVGDASSQIELGGSEIVDAAGMVVAPGFVDVHAHLRVPGYEYKEDIGSGTAAAAAGGFTTVCCMPNTDPVIDNRSVVEGLMEKVAVQARVRVFIQAAISINQAGSQLVEMGDLVDAGVIGFSDDGIPLASTALMRHALEYARQFDVPVSNHCEDPELYANAAMHEGEVSTRLGLVGTPRQSEEIMLSRDLLLAELTHGRYHCLHVTSAGSIDIIRRAKDRGVNVTAEVTPHHLTLTADLVAGRADPVSAAISAYDANTKVAPPLRERVDCDSLLAALIDGTIDCIASDHAPHATHEKDVEFADAPMGFSAFETTLASVMSLVHAGRLELTKAIEALTSGPAVAYKLPYGTLRAGAPADIVVFDPDEEFVVDASTSFLSKGKNTPLAGMPMRGVVHYTLVQGRIVFKRSGVDSVTFV